MELFNFCCPTKSKKTIDYISKWIDETDIELKQMHTDLSKLTASMNGIITEDLAPIFDEYAKTYDYSAAIPELATLQSEIENLSTQVEGKISTPLSAESGKIAVWGAGKTLVEGSAAIDDLALASHSHEISDVEGLDDELSKSPEITPIILLTTEHMEISGFSGETETKQSIKNIIRCAVGDAEGLAATNARFNIGIIDDDSKWHDPDYITRGNVHVWAIRGTVANSYDMNIDLYYGGSVYHTTVEGVTKTGSSIDYSNAYFYQAWELVGKQIAAKDNHKLAIPQVVAFDNNTYLSLHTTSDIYVIPNMWRSCTVGYSYPVVAEIWNDAQGTNKTKILGQMIATGSGSDIPSLELYVANYCIKLVGDGTFTAAQLASGEVDIVDADFVLALEDFTDLNLQVQ